MENVQGIFFKDFNNSFIPHILKEIYIDKVYHPFLWGKQGLTVLDIGANIGLFSFFAHQFANKVYAVEPAAEHIMVTNHMLRYNNIENVTTVKKAISNKNGKATFYHNPNRTMYSLRPEVNVLPQQAEEVETVTIEKLLEDLKLTHVDFMKLDVEGSEMEIVGGDAFDRVAGKIDVIMGENHAWNNTNPHQLQAAFEDRGFVFRWIPAEAQLFVARRI